MRFFLLFVPFLLFAALPLTPAHADDALIARLKKADAAKGKTLFRRLCFSCHSADKGGKSRIGPALWDVVGREVATAKGFRYSPALGKISGRWSYAQLDKYLLSPRKFAPGTRMAFGGLRNDGQRADMIAYLRSLSDKPAPLTATLPTATDTPTGPKKPKQTADEVPIPAGPGQAETRTYCGACHSLKLVIQQRLSRDRWDGLLDWMVEEQGMDPMPAKDRKLVLDYLGKHFSGK